MILDAANLDGQTGITMGTNDPTLDVRELSTGGKSCLENFEVSAQTEGLEFEIDEDGHLNFVSSLGSDKSGSIVLTFRRDGSQGSNIREIDYGEDGERMANRIIGTSSVDSGLSYAYNVTAAQAEYGDGVNDFILVHKKVFNEAQTQDELEALVEAYALQVAYPITEFSLVPESAVKRFSPITGTREIPSNVVDFEDVEVGDLVTVVINTENISQDTAKRIAELSVEVDENNSETIRYTLTRAGVYVTSPYLNSAEAMDIKRRLMTVEELL
jgi:hypothetical protein